MQQYSRIPFAFNKLDRSIFEINKLKSSKEKVRKYFRLLVQLLSTIFRFKLTRKFLERSVRYSHPFLDFMYHIMAMAHFKTTHFFVFL